MPMIKPFFFAVRELVLVSTAAVFLSLPVQAQQSEAEHESHHPDIYGEQALPAAQGTQATGAIPGTPQLAGMGKGKGGAMGSGMNKMMDGMMEKMGAPKPKDLYPSLMRLPELPPEQRDKVEGDAQRRMETGTRIMLQGFTALNQANVRQDFELMQIAVSDIEQGLAQYDSGLAAKRALAEGQAPRNVALQWFKREMNLLPTLSAQGSFFFMGMSPLHTGVMLILLLFAAVMVWMYLFKMRRAATLLGELRDRPAVAEKREQTVSTPSIDTAEFEIPATGFVATPVASPLGKGGRYNGPLKIVGIFIETHDVKTFRLALPDGQPLPFTYEPGQFATLTLTIPGQSKPVKRSYTIASSPTQRDYLELTIKREDQGIVSRFMHDVVVLNDQLTVKVPSGQFYFNGRDTDSVVLVSGGVGITPMMSAARYLTDQCWAGDIYFLFCARTSHDFIFQQELAYLQARHKNLHVLVSMTRVEGTSWMGPQGRFTPQLINDFVPDIATKEIHICGPQSMMDGVAAMLTELGVPQKLIQTEAFGAAPKVKKPPQPAGIVAPAAQTGFTAQFSESQKSALMGAGETLLEAAEAVDVEIENSCRAGSCGSCIVKLVSGEVSMEVDDGLGEDEKEQGYILACQAIPSTDVDVEA
ncbi:2Fe-2S iron-sulfur cluster-binding protein [Dasania marina]|uniref:2Fe-2S iron-sulfur cluster-binding protein n=1 Tax=Dasania marina TaxID=471499 RepID=UPI0030D9370B|tara:strand:+ start:3037 stop:4962 length:1926 start_codon:yes stop_codon:yes gene_type:complete